MPKVLTKLCAFAVKDGAAFYAFKMLSSATLLRRRRLDESPNEAGFALPSSLRIRHHLYCLAHHTSSSFATASTSLPMKPARIAVVVAHPPPPPLPCRVPESPLHLQLLSLFLYCLC
ncbi:hypothetical protein Q3G72_006267 [Acer saccharum]|nr:hypothetical protein Q3G72_006267 [Acer saccharum]